jgi:glycosidase
MRMPQKLFLLPLLFLSFITLQAQQIEIYPPHWWTDMKTNQVQLLLRSTDPEFSKKKWTVNYPGITITKSHSFENGKYLALDVVIAAEAKSGVVTFLHEQGKKKVKIQWQLNERRPGRGAAVAKGVNSSDFIYLLMPDRFSNGNQGNDKLAGMRDQTLNRDSLFHRHGGDLQGIINHLAYFKELGVTSLWSMPVIENDRTHRSEHGYAFTNHYKIDPRLGGHVAYKQLSDSLHKHGLKLIQDAVYNHVDIDHILFKEKPSKDWFHTWPSYTGTSYKDQPLFDPYQAVSDKKITTDGWFTPFMPDWNHTNPFVANYLIQHAIWSVEEFGVDGWRVDTYLYNDLDFMNRCNAALLAEYPTLTIFGELWVHGVPSQAYFVENNIEVPFKSNLQGATDFQTRDYGIIPALTQAFGWTEGVNKLYTTLSFDYLYKDPTRNVLFLDNHDVNRFFSVVGEDIAKQKMGIQWLLTCRGIPQVYYGTEINMKGFTNPDGWVRLDFPGGWTGDKKNAFTGAGLTDNEASVQALVKKLANYRKQSTALKTGKMMQYVPKDGLYVYFRYDDQQTVMCVMNTSDKPMDLDFANYGERTSKFSTAIDVLDSNSFDLSAKAKISTKTMWVLELKK